MGGESVRPSGIDGSGGDWSLRVAIGHMEDFGVYTETRNTDWTVEFDTRVILSMICIRANEIIDIIWAPRLAQFFKSMKD